MPKDAQWFEVAAAGQEEEVAEVVALHSRKAVSSSGFRSLCVGGSPRKAAQSRNGWSSNRQGVIARHVVVLKTPSSFWISPTIKMLSSCML